MAEFAEIVEDEWSHDLQHLHHNLQTFEVVTGGHRQLQVQSLHAFRLKVGRTARFSIPPLAGEDDNQMMYYARVTAGEEFLLPCTPQDIFKITCVSNIENRENVEVQNFATLRIITHSVAQSVIIPPIFIPMRNTRQVILLAKNNNAYGLFVLPTNVEFGKNIENMPFAPLSINITNNNLVTLREMRLARLRTMIPNHPANRLIQIRFRYSRTAPVFTPRIEQYS